MVMSLAVLLNLGDYGTEHNDFDTLASQWRAYEIFPMACNVRMVSTAVPARPTPATFSSNSCSTSARCLSAVTAPAPTTTGPHARRLLRRANSIP